MIPADGKTKNPRYRFGLWACGFRRIARVLLVGRQIVCDISKSKTVKEVIGCLLTIPLNIPAEPDCCGQRGATRSALGSRVTTDF